MPLGRRKLDALTLSTEAALAEYKEQRRKLQAGRKTRDERKLELPCHALSTLRGGCRGRCGQCSFGLGRTVPTRASAFVQIGVID